MQQNIFELPLLLFMDGVQDEPGKKGEESGNPNEADNNERRELKYQSGQEIGMEDRDKKDDTENSEEAGNQCEKEERAVIFKHVKDRQHDFDPIRQSLKLRIQRILPFLITGLDGADVHVLVQCMDRHLSLDLEAPADHREGLHKPFAECPAAGHDIRQGVLEYGIDTFPYKCIPKTMESPGIFLVIRRG